MSEKVSKNATRMAVRHYLGEIWRFRKYSIPGLVLVSIGSILVAYAPTLVVAAAIERFTDSVPSLEALVPYLLGFAGGFADFGKFFTPQYRRPNDQESYCHHA